MEKKVIIKIRTENNKMETTENQQRKKKQKTQQLYGTKTNQEKIKRQHKLPGKK